MVRRKSGASGRSASRPRGAAPAESEAADRWFDEDPAGPATAAPLARLPASGLLLEPGALVFRKGGRKGGGEEARLSLREIASVELDLRLRPLRLLVVASLGLALAAITFLVLGVEHVPLALAPLALAPFLVPRIILVGALDVELRAGGIRRLPLARSDALRLRREGRRGASFLDALERALDDARVPPAPRSSH